MGAASSSPDLPDGLEGKIQERREPLPPLVQELSAMHEHQCVYPTRGDEPGGHDRFSEGGRGGQDAVVMSQQVVGGGLLIRPERSMKRHVQRQSGKPLVLDGHSHLVRIEQGRDFPKATPGQGEMLRKLLGTTNHARLVEGRQPHGLGAIELRVLERGEPMQSIQHRRRQSRRLDEDQVAADDSHLGWQRAVDDLVFLFT